MIFAPDRELGSDQKDQEFGVWESLAGGLVKYGVALSISLTVISIVSSFFLFERWGLNYSTVATPVDIIVNALEVFSIALPQILILVAAASIQPIIPIKTFIRYKIEIISAILYVIAYIYVVWSGHLFESIVYLRERGGIGSYADIISAFVMAFCFIIIWRINGKYTPFAIFALSQMVIYMQALDQGSKDRFAGIVLAGKSGHCKYYEHVVWMGNSSIITSCDPPPYDAHRIFFIMERSGHPIAVYPNLANQSKRD